MIQVEEKISRKKEVEKDTATFFSSEKKKKKFDISLLSVCLCIIFQFETT
jgi:hypothetical protein